MRRGIIPTELVPFIECSYFTLKSCCVYLRCIRCHLHRRWLHLRFKYCTAEKPSILSRICMTLFGRKSSQVNDWCGSKRQRDTMRRMTERRKQRAHLVASPAEFESETTPSITRLFSPFSPMFFFPRRFPLRHSRIMEFDWQKVAKSAIAISTRPQLFMSESSRHAMPGKYLPSREMCFQSLLGGSLKNV